MDYLFFCLYFKQIVFWRKHLAVLLCLCILALFLLTMLGLMDTHHLTMGDAGPLPTADPGGGGPW